MKRRQKRHSITKLPPALTFALLVLAFGAGACLVPTLIFAHAPALGAWWWVILLAYFTALAAVAALLRHRREMERLRFALGDELFAEKFPKEWERMQKRGSDTFFVSTKKVSKEND